MVKFYASVCQRRLVGKLQKQVGRSKKYGRRRIKAYLLSWNCTERIINVTGFVPERHSGTNDVVTRKLEVVSGDLWNAVDLMC